MAVTLGAGVFMHAFVFLRVRSDASLFTSSLVLFYFFILQWSGLSSDLDQACNPYHSSFGNSVAVMTLGLVFTFMSLFVVSFSEKSDEDYKSD
jgi:hypothetical protein